MMMDRTRSWTRALVGFGLVVIAICISAPAARGQAFVGDAGGVSAGLDYNFARSAGPANAPDEVVDSAGTDAHTVTLEVEYTPIEDLALGIDIPMMAIKYTGVDVHTPPGDWDDKETHTTLQDGRFGARYQLFGEPFVFTPHLGLTIPLMDYETNGFAAVGRHLKQLHGGASIARVLDPILPNLYLHAMYEFTLSEKADVAPTTSDINQNRSDMAFQMGYFFLDGDLELNVAANMRMTHGGVSFEREAFNDATPEQQLNHDVLLDEDFVYLGGGVGYALTETLQLGIYARFFLRGYNTRLQDIFGLNLGWAIR
jgi:hypothetical protein